MKLAGLTAAGAILGGTSDAPKAEATAPPAPSVDFSEANLPVLFDVDVCVVGGGSAGTAAAVSAARKGAKTVLVERGISLGGLATQGCVYPCMPTYIDGSDTPYIEDLNKRMESQGISPFYEVADADGFYGGGRARYIPEYLSLVYDEMCEEAGAHILYNASLAGVVTDEGKIVSCVVQTVEGLSKIRATVFIDATGDALLSRFAGVPAEKGSETTGRNQPMSLRFEMGGVDVGKVYHFSLHLLKDYKKGFFDTMVEKALREHRPPFIEFAKWKKNEEFFKSGVASGELTEDDILYIQAFTIPGKSGVMSMNCPEMPALSFSSTDAVSQSRAISFGRKMMRRLAAFFIHHVSGFEHAYISREASMVGVRESWRIRGKYYMDAEDYFKARHFPDAVCRTAYPIDIHDVKLDVGKKLQKGQYYEVPYRALVTNEISNLLVAGRCASGSFAAQASFRIQPTCMSMGEAAGIAAAWGISHGVDVNALRWEQIPAGERSYVSAG
ncbi:MAG: FAD-dependent oxidoreductase [Schwartzia sp.]|nr:FAD-dependent oxidoreductase [Schwartzia sp. (in: firmicutes)]